jgi:alpha-N-arabinofuranosidase
VCPPSPPSTPPNHPSTPSYYAELRRKYTGRDEPHAVKLWGLGNEVWGDWQVGQQSAPAYAEKAKQWAKALRLLDPALQLVACGQSGRDAWDATVLDALVDRVQYTSCVPRGLAAGLRG